MSALHGQTTPWQRTVAAAGVAWRRLRVAAGGLDAEAAAARYRRWGAGRSSTSGSGVAAAAGADEALDEDVFTLEDLAEPPARRLYGPAAGAGSGAAVELGAVELAPASSGHAPLLGSGAGGGGGAARQRGANQFGAGADVSVIHTRTLSLSEDDDVEGEDMGRLLPPQFKGPSGRRL